MEIYRYENRHMYIIIEKKIDKKVKNCYFITIKTYLYTSKNYTTEKWMECGKYIGTKDIISQILSFVINIERGRTYEEKMDMG